MGKRTRILALLISIGLLLVLSISSAYLACEAGHDCIGEECEICENIAWTRALLQSFAGLGVVLLMLLALHDDLRASNNRTDNIHIPVHRTLVSWKIRLNN
ncbi:MAG: hypothetical protein IJ214_08435 [Clostridia bacterium]|nr:hypothetical protein [Clostridia bacterium]